jgi:hypothetical protein
MGPGQGRKPDGGHILLDGGGQIRNVALHAALLALEAGGAPGLATLEAALVREYRRSGQALPPGTVEP